MARIGFQKAKTSSVADRGDAIINKQGGIGHEITDPTQRLLAMTAYLGEPGFFPEKGAQEDHGLDYDPSVLDDRGREIFKTAIEVLNGDNPEDVLVIAHWARQKLNMRLFPQILMTAAARYLKADNKVNPIIRYMPKTAHRPDDLLQVHALYNALFGKKCKDKKYPRATFPGRLKRAMARTFANYSIYQLVKYNRPQSHPNYADLLGSMRGGRIMPKSMMRKSKKREGLSWPLSKGLRDFLIDGKMTDELPKSIKARHDFMRLPEDTPIEVIDAHAKAARLTWEDIVSKFGSKSETDERRKAIWSLAARQMGAMALLKNLRNLLRAGVEDIGQRTSKISDPDFIKTSRLLPFRFLSAYNALTEADDLPVVDRKKVQENISKGLDEASEQNVPEFPGVTAVFVDTSASMRWTTISAKSEVSVSDVAALMAGILNRRCETALLYSFAATIGEVTGCSKTDSVLSIMRKVVELPAGYSTNIHLCFDQLSKLNVEVDRVVILSDNECSSRRNVTGDYAQRYIRRNNGVFVHAIDLQAHGQSAVHTDLERYNLVSGFSESIFAALAQYEARYGKTETSKARKVSKVEENVLPTIESLREKFTVTEQVNP